MNSSFVYLRPLNVACIRAQGPYGKASKEAWSKIFKWLDATGMRQSVGCGWGLLLDDPKLVPADKCRYEACIEIVDGYQDKAASEFSFRRLPAGAYARRRHVGDPAGLASAIVTLRDEWAPRHGLVIDSRRPVIEVYLDDPAIVPVDKLRVDVCIPVTSQAHEESSAA